LPRRRKQSSGIWIFIAIIFVLLGAFAGAIVYSWDMPPPLRKIEKILPPVSFDGVNVAQPTD
jgi:hypothetical protein